MIYADCLEEAGDLHANFHFVSYSDILLSLLDIFKYFVSVFWGCIKNIIWLIQGCHEDPGRWWLNFSSSTLQILWFLPQTVYYFLNLCIDSTGHFSKTESTPAHFYLLIHYFRGWLRISLFWKGHHLVIPPLDLPTKWANPFLDYDQTLFCLSSILHCIAYFLIDRVSPMTSF